MNCLVDHPKQLIHFVCFVNMPHFSSLKSEPTGSSYILVKCVVCACTLGGRFIVQLFTPCVFWR